MERLFGTCDNFDRIKTAALPHLLDSYFEVHRRTVKAKIIKETGEDIENQIEDTLANETVQAKNRFSKKKKKKRKK